MAFNFDIGSAVGGIASAISSAKAADRAVKRQIEWERERATHAHQWEVEDLKAAGLNPILSAGGQGAVTGSISAPTPDFSGISNISTSNSAASQARTARKAQKAQEKLQNSQIAQQEALTKLTQIQTSTAAQDLSRKAAEFEAIKGRLKAEKEYNNSKFGKVGAMVSQGTKDLSPLLNAFSFGLGGFAIKRGIGAAAAAARAHQTQNKVINNFPKGWKSPGLRTLKDVDPFKIPTIYRNGYRAR